MRSTRGERFQEPAAKQATLQIAPSAALYIGPPLAVGFHRSAVTCVGEALDGSLSARVRGGASHAGPARVIFVRAGAEHEIDAAAARVAFLYLAPNEPAIALLRSATSPVRGEPALRTSDATLASMVATAPDKPAIDPRVRRVMEAFSRGESLTESVPALAMRHGLSGSRLMHLFREHAGVALRRYRLWSRLRAATLAMAKGESKTRAAIEHGFSSHAHCSAAFRAMFGATPSTLSAVKITGESESAPLFAALRGA